VNRGEKGNKDRWGRRDLKKNYYERVYIEKKLGALLVVLVIILLFLDLYRSV
jgi:hypothetical protein